MRHLKSCFNRLLLACAVLLILFASAAAPASAASLTVGTSGQFKTIAEAVNAAHPGDTIVVAPGNYAENIVIDKPLTIQSQGSGSTVTAADPSKDVLQLQGAGIHIQGLTLVGASGASGVHVYHATGCVVTGITAHGNARAVYLDGASNCEVSDSNLANNGYGVYCDGASHNTISGNVATGERGAEKVLGDGKALGDGIYVFHGDGNTITHNDLSANHIFGISLFGSSNNSISNNAIRSNEQIGVRLRDSDNNILTFNTISANGQPGKELDFPPAASSFGQLGIALIANGNQIYLNNFIDQSIPMSNAQTAILDSSQEMTYTYNNAPQTGQMGNYYSDYKGSDTNGDGIGTTASAYGDKYPLVRPFEDYGTISMAGATTALPFQTPTGQNERTTSIFGTQNSSGIGLPGFETWGAVIGFLLAPFPFILLGGALIPGFETWGAITVLLAAFVLLGVVIKKYYF
jgi:parallel beta-helix repeat protein